MKVGIVSEYWTPFPGGQEAFASNLAAGLHARGVPTCCLAGSDDGPPAPPDHSGAVPVTKLTVVPRMRDLPRVRASKTRPTDPDPWVPAFIAAIEAWVKVERPTHVILNGPRLDPGRNHDPLWLIELCSRIKKTGARVGTVWHTYFVMPAWRELYRLYGACGHWPAALDVFQQQEQQGKTQFERDPEMPPRDGVDFVISNTAALRRIADPCSKLHAFVLHPPLDFSPHGHTAALPLREVDVTVVNPCGWKGALYSTYLALFGSPTLRMRVIAGWGGALELRNMVALEPLADPDRIEILPAVRPLTVALRATRALFAPTRLECYGMSTAEAAVAGIPIVTTDLPTVREAVGDGALLVSPLAGPEVWLDALRSCLDNRSLWAQRALDRGRDLERRQRQEIDDLVRFLAET